ncbi:MAG: hypothetical protein VZS44_05270 [Bacilli bacterium]|nr:hypothetical protein [Bacilli bacterium]
MMNSIKLNYIIHKDYKDLINKNIYENIILDIMNESDVVFPGKYKHINEQSNGESDFISMDDMELLEAKTIFPRKQCESLSLGDLKEFYEIIVSETNDVFESLMNKKDNLNSTMLYKELVKAFKKIKPKENAIIFIPFPFTLEIEESLSSLFASDIFSQIIFEIKKENANFFREHNVYLIYPNLENKIILKSLTTGKVEYLKGNQISNYIYVEYLEN